VNGLQCDTCRRFSVSPAGWLYLVRHPGEQSPLAGLFGTPAEPLTFCSMRCVAEYAYAQAVTSEPATETGPQ
jgi:hypothetical protein